LNLEVKNIIAHMIKEENIVETREKDKISETIRRRR
jgi:hypothetical protein